MARATEEIAPTDVTKHLGGMTFPAQKEDLLEYARENEADEKVLAAIEEMPEQDYGNMADVMRGFGAARS